MADNADIRGMIRDLALKRDSIDRRQLYFALVQAEVWVPVSAKSAAGHVTPGDLGGFGDEFPAVMVDPGTSHTGSLRALSGKCESEHWHDSRPRLGVTGAIAPLVGRVVCRPLV